MRNTLNVNLRRRRWTGGEIQAAQAARRTEGALSEDLQVERHRSHGPPRPEAPNSSGICTLACKRTTQAV
jgi:hypothetical protein